MRLLWFVLAGFVLGFAASTLWEWYYYRKHRIRLQGQRLAEQVAELRMVGEATGEGLPEAGDGDWRPVEYQSPGVFLEAERPAGEAASTPPAAVPLPAPEAVAAPADLGDASLVAAPLSDPVPEVPAPVAPAVAAAFEEEEEPPATALPITSEEDATASSAQARFRAPIPRRSLGYPDDLAEIEGIGEVYRRRLYDAGIFTWRQVAQTDVETLRATTRAQASANVEEWPAQAQALAEKHGRMEATYVGPVPDDLTEIPGIGPVNAQQLYRAGICTFEQLATTLPDELQTLFTAPVAGHAFDFDKWLARAGELASAKRTSSTAQS